MRDKPLKNSFELTEVMKQTLSAKLFQWHWKIETFFIKQVDAFKRYFALENSQFSVFLLQFHSANHFHIIIRTHRNILSCVEPYIDHIRSRSDIFLLNSPVVLQTRSHLTLVKDGWVWRLHDALQESLIKHIAPIVIRYCSFY